LFRSLRDRCFTSGVLRRLRVRARKLSLGRPAEYASNGGPSAAAGPDGMHVAVREPLDWRDSEPIPTFRPGILANVEASHDPAAASATCPDDNCR
jgi:hypothetical protein